MTITIKDGKLYQDGAVIRPEIGNPDHIKAVNDLQKRFDELTSEEGMLLGIDTDGNFTVSTMFQCFCGAFVYKEFELDPDREEFDVSDADLSGTVNCYECNKQYELEYNDYGELIARIEAR